MCPALRRGTDRSEMLMTDTTQGKPDNDLSWLLEDFTARVPGAVGALLASRDGFRLATAGLDQNQADKMSAVMSGLYSLGGGVGEIMEPTGGGSVRQVIVEHDTQNLFVMSAGDGLPSGGPKQIRSDLGTVSSVLGALVEPETDPGMVGHEMATLIKSVAEHLVTPTRQGDAHSGDGQ
jgi:predicted regulator of Ras-like GTPase activity (Roadblock/LC7/MglB family)